MPAWRKQGTHRYYCEDDLLLFELHGPFTLEDTKLMVMLTAALADEHDYFLTVFDARDGLNMTPESRRYVNQIAASDPQEGATLVVGASLAVRTMTQLIVNAASLFGKKTAPVHFCSTLDELPGWLAAQRQLYRRKRPGQTNGQQVSS